MSTIVCAISGHAPEEPVFAPKTGYVYEKRLIEKHLASAGKCPVTKEDLSKDDLVGMKANKAVRPRPASAASIPGMLSLLQSEWDALMTETYELKTHLDTTRKQLSHALYQHDAACRVIARLLRERDQARSQVAQLQEQLASASFAPSGDVVMDAADQGELGLSPDIIARMQENAKALTKLRKKKDFPELAPKADIQRLACPKPVAPHQSSAPGITCVDVHKVDDIKVVSGGVDQQVILFDAASNKVVQKLNGHGKKVTSVAFHGTRDIILSSSADSTARIWKCTDASNWKAPYTCAHVVKRHQAEVSEVSVHPLGDYLLCGSLDKSWSFYDLNVGRCIRHVKDLASGFGCAKFHPDGMILAGGTEEKTVQVWDIKDQAIVATLSGHEGNVKALSFSENGYYLATASFDGTVKLWDLRKPVLVQTLEVSKDAVNTVRFDQTGQYLAAGADSVKVYNFETKASLAQTVELKDHTDAVMGVCFGLNAKSLASVSMDRKICNFKIP
mmetsp:Transcript_75935/g.180542  ORF Transcript_75935/g.180542 Transcript_75935/m.180542 type:complete len:503 (+) Transcript_75935:156-1664(+)|eukprot:CAMPEP_0178411246 /NCGR_PEP_ID=MMETSP0689_2-20121128/21395_1 /TAXON_ID=160604 /ORGANISM="Amphidinium massartii, Strain CS-259" /LENGTH=502 /DNA_ID=CAMNT_0020032445 /DNA_START=159 /DNA_END=1667 /DNA_ORIENTATION=-